MADNTRIPISKGQRFEIFKRDRFTCQWCGRHPPQVILQVDHIKPVVEGGTNEDHNLITACMDCNAGKGRRLLDETIPILDLVGRAELIAERRAQVEAYEAELKRERAAIELGVIEVISVYEDAFANY